MKNYLKFLSCILFIGLTSSCSSDDSTNVNADYTVYKNQTDDLNADALQLNYVAPDNSHIINFYGNFDVDKNPTITNTITYQQTNSDTIVNLVIDPITRRISSLFTTVNGVNSDVVMKFDYISDTELQVSFHEYNWTTNTSGNIFLTKVIGVVAPDKNQFHLRDGGFDFAYNISALALGVSAAEIAAVIGGGWSGLAALSGAATALVAAASSVAIVGAAAIAATLFFLNAASASEITVSDLVPPSQIPLQNPVTPGNNPTANLQQSPCADTNLSFNATMTSEGGIIFTAPTGGVNPYTYLVGSQMQVGNPVFLNNYSDDNYVVAIKDANGCMTARLVWLDRTVSIVGNWKLSSVIEEGTETAQPCWLNNTITFYQSGGFTESAYTDLDGNGTCEPWSTTTGTYNINNQTLSLTTNGTPFFEPTVQILLLSETTLQVGYGNVVETWLKN